MNKKKFSSCFVTKEGDSSMSPKNTRIYTEVESKLKNPYQKFTYAIGTMFTKFPMFTLCKHNTIYEHTDMKE